MTGYPHAAELNEPPPRRRPVPRPVRRPRTAMRRMRDDSGAVAILVAISVSTFLLGFAALAVDFGQVYTRQSELQSVADVAALAGATELPDVAAARAKALQTLCADANRLAGWDTDGTCPASAVAPTPTWVTNSTPDDGEIVLYRTFDTTTGRFDPASATTSDGQEATGIRVKLPPSTVQFGLSRSFGADDISVSKAATARIGTPEGRGILPIGVTRSDLTDGTRNREFCIVDPLAGSGTGGAPAPTSPARRITLNPATETSPTLGDTITITPQLPTLTFPTRTTRVFVDGVQQTVVSADLFSVRFQLVDELPTGAHTVWVVWGFVSPEISFSATLTINPGAALPPAGGGDPCQRRDANRGILDIARDVTADATDVQRNDDLAENIKHGIIPTPHRYNEFPVALIPLVDDVLRGLQCLPPGPVVPGLIGVLRRVLGGANVTDINCVDTRDSGFADGLTEGLLGDDNANPGRLKLQCSDEPTVFTRGREIDGTDLFTLGSQLVDQNVTNGQALLTTVRSGNVARAAILGKAFACPRLALVPVINPDDNNVGNATYPIVDFTYVWIEDDADGLVYEGTSNRLRAVKFYILDPAFFGQTVSGSPKVGPWLGPDFPREVLLVKDQDDDV